jgi:cell wall-associated NlpC family hydrolase
MTRRIALCAALAALLVPAGAYAADSYVIVPDSLAPASALPSALAPNVPGEIAVDESFTTRPLWVEQVPVDELQPIWERAGAAYGVPWQALAAIDKIESDFGNNMGPSSAGAVGWMQFMPDTWLRWGVDANGDGVADPWNAEDAIFAAARYLAASGAATDLPRALYSYNHADWYVNEVLALTSLYGGGTMPSASDAVSPPPDLSSLVARVNSTRRALDAARAAERGLAPAVTRARAALGRTSLFSDQLAAQKRLTIAGVRYDRAHALTRRLEQQLADAQSGLDQARASAFTTTSAPFGALPGIATSGSFGAPAAAAQAAAAADGPAGGALSFALAKLGTPYQWGGNGPLTYDCSGLVQAAYASAGIALPRVAQDQFDAGPQVPPGEPLQPGDLVFFGSDAAHIVHVGMVSSAGLMIDAPYTGTVVRFDSYVRSGYVGATRPAAAAADPVVDFSTSEPESLAAGEILFTKNP